MDKNKQNQRLSQKQKNANNYQWYKDQIDMLDTEYNGVGRSIGGVDEFKNIKVNYDLFNNILNLSDFEYVCKPFGAEAGELPAKMVNRDIVSGKIKAVLGMEESRPFNWRVIATNPEATTRKEKEEFGRIKEYVVNKIMLPIRQQIEMQYQEQLKGQKLTPDEVKQVQQKIAQEVQQQTPPEIRKYMQRDHQDIAEVMSHQLLEYLTQKCDLKTKFNKAFKHGLLSAKSILYVGILNGEPEVWNVNSLRFNCDLSPDSDFIEDGEWATCEYRMTPSEIVKYFGDELKPDEIDSIYQSWRGYRNDGDSYDLFDLDERYNDYDDNSTLRVLHGTWKSLRKIGFLTYMDENGQLQETIVSEEYKLNKEAGDIKLEWEWIPESYETWKIKASEPIYVNMRPIPGQYKDLDNLYHCKLPYYGVVYDSMNSLPTSLMDRLKVYQYYYNIVMYRLELLLASDKGKKILMNINMIPDSIGIDIEKWQYFAESTPYMWYNPNEEGTGYNDVNTVGKVMDLSVATDIQKYIEIAEYLRTQAGKSVGITEQVEGQIGPNEAVRNTQQAIVQSSNILELYFKLHSHLKKNVLEALIETAKIAYSGVKSKKLSYVLDDMSVAMLELDTELLDNSTLGIFVSDAGQAQKVKDLLVQLTHAAVQNQKIELSDVIAVIRQNNVVETEETLRIAEENRRKYEQAMQQQQLQAQAEEKDKERQREKEKFEEEKELIRLKGEEERKTVVVKEGLLGASFNPDLDKNKNGVNDFIEIAKHGLQAEIAREHSKLERDKLEHQKEVDKEKLKNEKEKIANEKKKIQMGKTKSKQ